MYMQNFKSSCSSLLNTNVDIKGLCMSYLEGGQRRPKRNEINFTVNGMIRSPNKSKLYSFLFSTEFYKTPTVKQISR